MAITLFGSGTQTATVTTEHFLSSPNVAGKFMLYVDLVNMVAGDVVELRVYKMVLTGGTQRVVYFTQFAGPQPTDALIAVSEEIANNLTDTNAVRFSLKQTFGTGRNFPWAVLNTEDFTAAVPANVTQIDGLATSGNNATLNLKQLNIVNSAGSAVIASATGSNGHGITASGNGSGEGITATGGATGHGIEATGGATSGDGIKAAAAASGIGIEAIGVGTTMPGLKATGGATTSPGIHAVGGGVADGALFESGTGATGNGFTTKALSTNGFGWRSTGAGSSAGFQVDGGATGHGAAFVGGATSGSGIRAVGQGVDSHGIFGAGGATGFSHGMMLRAGDASGHGLFEDGPKIGSTGNDTTHLHLSTLTYGDDEINGWLLWIFDSSENEVHFRWVEDWVNATKLATVATLPFTPQNATDRAVLMPVRQDVDVVKWLGTAASTPTVAGVPNVNVKTWNDLTTVALPLVPTTAGRTLDVSVGGEAGLDWANIGSPTTAQNLSATNIDVDQVVASVSGAVGSVTGAVGSVTGAVGSVGAGGISAASFAAGAVDAAALAADAGTEIGTAVWATAARTLTAATNITSTGGTTVPQTGDSFARLGAPAGASVSADIATIDNFVDTEVAAILAAVDTEVAAILALLDDARGEPAQGAPPVNPDMATKVDYLYKAWRNKKTNDGTDTKLFADDATTVDHKQATSESGGTVTKGEWVTGP